MTIPVVVLAGGVTLIADPPPWLWLITPPLVFAGYLPLLLVAALAALPGRLGVAFRVLLVVVITLVGAWHIASYLRFRDQGFGLTVADVCSGLREPQVRAFIIDQFLSWRLATLAATVAGLAWVGGMVFTRLLSGRTSALLWLSLITLAVLSSAFMPVFVRSVGASAELHAVVIPTLPPWSGSHSPREYGDTDETADPDIAVARQRSVQAIGAEWSSEGSAAFAALRGRYVSRDVVVLLLESHRLSDVAPYGRGAFAHEDLCPVLRRFGRSSTWFSGYFPPGQGTIWSLYALLTGLTPPTTLSTHEGAGATGGNQLTAAGPLPRFQELGYQCDVLVGCDYTFWDLKEMLRHAGASGPLNATEQALVAGGLVTQWGLDDPAIYDIALRRLTERRDGTPRLQIIKSSSNHQPYIYRHPHDRTLTPDHRGGMVYADHCLQRFLDGLAQIPPERQPVLFITGDHGHMERLERNQPLYTLSLEAMRVPAFLRLPDGHLQGETIDDLLSHQDLLDVLRQLVDPRPATSTERLAHAKRRFLPIVQSATYGIITPTHYFPNWGTTQGRRIFRLDGLWRVTEDRDPQVAEQFRRYAEAIAADHARLWRRAKE